MATFTLNADTPETIFDQNEQQNGFFITTTAVPGTRRYRISRERKLSTGTQIDYIDFTLDMTIYASGVLVTQEIPYCPSLFTVIPALQTLPFAGVTRASFSGEIFKILFVTPTVEGDPAREIPSYINHKRQYTISGVSKLVKFIYYSVINGQTVLMSPLGNVAFDDHYDADSKAVVPSIDTTKHMSIIPGTTIDYHVVRVSTTPNMVITTGTLKTDEASESYTIDNVLYTLRAVPGGTQSWVTADGTRKNGFRVFLSFTQLSTPREVNSIVMTPQESILSFDINPVSQTEYEFLIAPVVGVSSLELRIYFTWNNITTP